MIDLDDQRSIMIMKQSEGRREEAASTSKAAITAASAVDRVRDTHRQCTYADVIKAVDQRSDLSTGVHQNLCSTVVKAAKLVSPAGLSASVNIEQLAGMLDELTPGRAGMQRNSLAAFKSNLRRALQCAGFTVVPGRHTVKLSEAWASLARQMPDEGQRRALSRLSHVASENGWSPEEITDAHIDRFRRILRETNLKSKADKVIGNTLRAWRRAQSGIPGWPQRPLLADRGTDRFYKLAWETFPPSFLQEVEDFVDPRVDWLDAVDDRQPLKNATKKNYREALLRAASILVRGGMEPDSVQGIADIVKPERVRRVLEFLRDRSGRKKGGHVGYVAFVLYRAAQVARLDEKDLEILKKYVDVTKDRRRGMSDRTWKRLVQFDDERAVNELYALPHRLVETAAKLPVDMCQNNSFSPAAFAPVRGSDASVRKCRGT